MHTAYARPVKIKDIPDGKVAILDGKLYIDRPEGSPETYKSLAVYGMGRTSPDIMARLHRLYPELETIDDLKTEVKERQKQYRKEIQAWEKTEDAWQYVDGEKYTEEARTGYITAPGKYSIKMTKTINPLPAAMSHGMRTYRALEQIMASHTPGDQVTRMRVLVKTDPQRYFNKVTIVSEHIMSDTIALTKESNRGGRPVSENFNKKIVLESTRRGSDAAKEFNKRPYGFKTKFSENEPDVEISIRNGITTKSGIRISVLQVLGDRISSETELDFDTDANVSAESILGDVVKDRAHRLSRDPRESTLSHKTFHDFLAPLQAGHYPKGDRYTTILPTTLPKDSLRAEDFELHLREGNRIDGRIRLIESRINQKKIEEELKDHEDGYNGIRFNNTEGIATFGFPGEVYNQALHPGVAQKGLTEQEQIYNYQALIARWLEDFPERTPTEMHFSKALRKNRDGVDFEMFLVCIRFKTAPDAPKIRKDILTGEALPEKQYRRVVKGIENIKKYMAHYGPDCAVSRKFQSIRAQWSNLRETYRQALDYENGIYNGTKLPENRYKLPKEEAWRIIEKEVEQRQFLSKNDPNYLARHQILKEKERKVLEDKMFREILEKHKGEAQDYLAEVPDFVWYKDDRNPKKHEYTKAEIENFENKIEAQEEKILKKMEELLPYLADQEYIDEARPLEFINDSDETCPFVIPGYVHPTLQAISNIGYPSFRGAEISTGDGNFEIEHMTPQFAYDHPSPTGVRAKVKGTWGENFLNLCLQFANRGIIRPQDEIYRTSFNVTPRAEVLGDRTAEPFIRIVMDGLYIDRNIRDGNKQAPTYYEAPDRQIGFYNGYELEGRYLYGRGFREGPVYPYGSKQTRMYINEDGLINSNKITYEIAEQRELLRHKTGQQIISTHRQQDLYMLEDAAPAFYGITCNEDGFGMAIIDEPSGTDPEDSPRTNNRRRVWKKRNWQQIFSGNYRDFPRRVIKNFEHHYMYGSHMGHLRDPITGDILHTGDAEPAFREFAVFGYEESESKKKSLSTEDAQIRNPKSRVGGIYGEMLESSNHELLMSLGPYANKIFSAATLEAMKNK